MQLHVMLNIRVDLLPAHSLLFTIKESTFILIQSQLLI